MAADHRTLSPILSYLAAPALVACLIYRSRMNTSFKCVWLYDDPCAGLVTATGSSVAQRLQCSAYARDMSHAD